MKKIFFIICSIGCCFSPLLAQVVPTNEWVSFWSDSCMINNKPLPISSVVRAYDPQGVLCGEFTVTTAGAYGLMPVYKDDPATIVDEGAISGDTIHFTINDMPIGPAAIWTANGDVQKVTFVAVEKPEINVNPTSILFRSIALKSSVACSLIIKNTGVRPLSIDSITTTYHFPRHFLISPISATLQPEESISVSVEFSAVLGSGIIRPEIIIHSNAWNATSFSVPFLTIIGTDIHTTSEWVNFWSDTSFFDGQFVRLGDVIDAFDPQGVHCGTFTVTTTGRYNLFVYRDNAATPSVDEGASPGDSLSFTINGYQASPRGPGQPIWSSNSDVVKLILEGSTNNRFPEPFRLVSPAQFARLDSTSVLPTFQWTKSINRNFWAVVHYQLWYSTDSLFVKSVVSLDTRDTLYTVPSSSPLHKNRRYYWKVKAFYDESLFAYGSGSDISPWCFDVGIPTSVNIHDEQVPTGFALHQNYPNPFNPSTTIEYGLPVRSNVRLVIYNVLGQVVRELINSEQQAGHQSVVWNANVASGMYFYRIEATPIENPSDRFIQTKKMLLMK